MNDNVVETHEVACKDGVIRHLPLALSSIHNSVSLLVSHTRILSLLIVRRAEPHHSPSTNLREIKEGSSLINIVTKLKRIT